MRTRPSFVRLGAATGVVGLVVLSAVVLAPHASAATTDETGPGAATQGLTGKACIAAARAWTEEAVAERLVRLDRLERDLDAAAEVADAHRSTLEALYVADRAGLRAVRSEVRRDATCGEAKKDARKVVTKFRVYVLVTPQTALVARGDHGVVSAAALEALEPAYTEAVAELPAGDLRTAAEAALADFAAAVDVAQVAYGGIADSVLALVPGDFPSSTAVLTDAAADARTGRLALARAAADRAALELLLG